MSFVTPVKGPNNPKESLAKLDETNFNDSPARKEQTVLSPNSKSKFQSLPIPAPFSNFLTIDKKLSDNSFVAKCDILQRSLVFKRHMGIKAFQQSLDRWISSTANEHTIHAYDVIPLKDDSVLQVTEYREACRNVYRAVAKLNVNVDVEIPKNFIKFLSEFILQISIGLYECHQRGLHHCNLSLEYIIVQKQKQSLANEHGFSHFFKLTYFCPWLEETFPFSHSDRHLIKLLLQKEGQLSRKDVQDMVRTKDLYAFGLTIIEILQGKTQKPKEPLIQFNAEVNSIPHKWAKTDQAMHIMEILNLCLTIQLNPKPLDKLKEIIQIASKMYSISFFPKYVIPKRIEPQNLKGLALKEFQKNELLKLTQNFTNRGVFLFLRGETEKALEFSEKAAQIYPQNYEAVINSMLVKWNLCHFSDQDLLTHIGKLSEGNFDEKTPLILFTLFKLALGYPLEKEEGEFLESFDKTQLPPQSKALLKIATRSKGFYAVKSSDQGRVILPENTFVEVPDPVKSIVISNNDEHFALISTFEVKIYSTRIGGGGDLSQPRKYFLPKPQPPQENEDDGREKLVDNTQDDLIQDSLMEDNQVTDVAGEDGAQELKQIVKFDEEDTGFPKKVAREYTEKEINTIMKKKSFMGCIDNTGQRIVFHITNIKKYQEDEDPIFIYVADLANEGRSNPNLMYDQFQIPLQLAKDEVHSISFLDSTSDILVIKSKALHFYTLKLHGLSAHLLSVTPAPLETRSIFSYPSLIDHFESLKSFIEDQSKQGVRVLLPAKDTRYVLTYSLTSCEVSVYEVMLKRVIRRFKLRNPEYSREVEIEQELREKERLEEERKKQQDLAAKGNQDSLEDEEEDDDDDEDEDEEEDKNSDEDTEQEGSESAKLKRKMTKKEKEEEEIKEKIKPFLELQSEQIQVMEISPKADYFVLVYNKKAVVVRVTPHEELAQLTLPIQMIKSISQYNPTPVQTNPEQESKRDRIRANVIKNPILLRNNLRSLYEKLVSDYKRFEIDTKENEKDYIRSQDTLRMSYYIDQAFETPQFLGIEREDIQRIRNFQSMDIAATVKFMKRKCLEGLSKFHSFDQIEFRRKTDKILSCVFTSSPDSSIAFVAFDRQVHAYDFLEKRLLFKLSVANVKEMHLCDSERILAIKTHTEQLHVFSVTLQTLNWQRLMYDKVHGYKPKDGMRRSSTETSKELGEEPEPTQDGDETSLFNVNASRFDEDQISNCKIMTFEENVKRLVFTRTYTQHYFMAAITNTKFTIYEVYADEASERQEPLEVKDISSISVACQRKQDVHFASVTSPQGLGKVSCLDFDDNGKKIVTGSINGMLVLWENGESRIQWLKVLYQENNSVDQVRVLSKRGNLCIVFTSQPEVNIYDLETTARTQILIPPKFGQCTKIHVERTESVLISQFFDKSFGVFNLVEKQFVKRIHDVNFSKCFIDANCTYLAGPDVRGRGIDFYWFKWENEITKFEKPKEQKEAKLNIKVPMPTKKEEQKKSSFCLLF